jgi:hypothetical protein
MLRRDLPVLDGLQNSHRLRQRRRLVFAYRHPLRHSHYGIGGLFRKLRGSFIGQLSLWYTNGIIRAFVGWKRLGADWSHAFLMRAYFLW